MKPLEAAGIVVGGLAVALVSVARSDDKIRVPPALEKIAKPQPGGRFDRFGDALPSADAVVRLGTARWRHGNHVSSVAITPDGKIVASAGGDFTVRLWERATGKELRPIPLTQGDGFFPILALSPDGKVLAVPEQGKVRLWEIPSGKELRGLEGLGGDGLGLVFSPDGKLLAVAGEQTIVWDLASGKELRRFTSFQQPVRAIAFSADSQRLALGDGNCIRIWEVGTGKRLVKLRRHAGDVTSVAFAPDGKSLASTGADNAVRLWNLDTGKELRQFGHPNTRRPTEHFVMEVNTETSSVAFSPDGKTLFAAVKDDRFIRAWNVATGKEVRRYEGHVGGSLCLVLSADGHTLVAGSGDSCIRLWDVETGKDLFPANGHRGRIYNLAFGAGGKTLMSAGRDGRLRVWDPAAAEELHCAGDDDDFIGYVAFSPDGHVAATARQDDETIQLWDMITGKPLRRIDCPHRGVNGMDFSADGKLLASVGDQNRLTLWEVATGKEVRHWTAQPNQLANVVVFGDGRGLREPLAFSPDGKLLATTLFDNNAQPFLHLWDTATGKHVRQFSLGNRGENVFRILFAPDGRVLATVSPLNAINLWDAATGKPLHKLEGLGVSHPQGMVNIECVAFAPDGQTLAAVGPGSKLIIWDVSTGKPVCELDTGQGWIGSVAYSPDGRTVATGGLDTTVLLWDLTGSPDVLLPMLGHKELDERWQALLGDAAPAFRARWALALRPEEAVPWLRERLQRVEAVPAALLNKLLADLDSKDFRTREKASEELGKRGEAVIAALHKVQKAKPALEVWKRVDAVLQKITAVQLTGERLRGVRAILVLEQAGTPAARKFLEELAQGVPEARLTQEAKAALERINRRSAAK